MSIDTNSRTPVSPAFAEAFARDRYGIDGRATVLPGEYDDNFRLSTEDGRDFVLKFMHPLREREFVEMLGKAHEHVAKRAPSLEISRVIESRAGGWLLTIDDDRGATRLAWMLSFVKGAVYANITPRSRALVRELGVWLGRLDGALADFESAAARRPAFKWDLMQAGWIREHLPRIADPAKRVLVEQRLVHFENELAPLLERLPKTVIHGDANDYNVIVALERAKPPRIRGVIDFGDMHWTARVNEVVVAGAYAILGESDPLGVLSQLVAGYDETLRLADTELAVVFPLVCLRLCVSVVNSAIRSASVLDDPYVTISEAAAWRALEVLKAVELRLAVFSLRAACGRETVVPGSERVVTWLRANAGAMKPVVGLDLHTAPSIVLDLSVSSGDLTADPAAFEREALTRFVESELERTRSVVAIGRYDEVRALYTAPLFAGASEEDERRTLHLGLDLFVAAGTRVSAPLDGVVHAVAVHPGEQDYGGVVVLAHQVPGGSRFFTLYGHLAPGSIADLEPGARVAAGESFARIGEPEENGGWTPHLHLQIFLDDLDRGVDLPGVARVSERVLWTGISPDPNLLLGIPRERFLRPSLAKEELSSKRRARLLGNLSVAYRDPLVIVRGWRTRLYDETGRSYLDVFNNVPLVGHSHPRVVGAAQRQLALLNTNTRYLHENVVRYAERLTEKMPPSLSVCAFVNSASEANELALRLARAHTRRDGVIVLEHAYHGNTSTLIDISPYKFDGPGGCGRKPWVFVAPLPDDFRGRYRRGTRDLGARYAAHVEEIVNAHPDSIAAFVAETLPSVGGQIVLPDGYLEAAYSAVRKRGGVCIADEVQVGFGRLGTCFFGFESQGVTPDIVVLGKPIGNGFPLAAVVTTPQIAASFASGMEYFSTFGGNPVACAAGLAVLEVLEEEGLQANAHEIGTYLKSRLVETSARFPLVGDVRGMGLFLGVELVRDRHTLEPATQEAAYVIERLRERGILAGVDGPFHNVLKIRPPLCLSRAEADRLVTTLFEILLENPLEVLPGGGFVELPHG